MAKKKPDWIRGNQKTGFRELKQKNFTVFVSSKYKNQLRAFSKLLDDDNSALDLLKRSVLWLSRIKKYEVRKDSKGRLYHKTLGDEPEGIFNLKTAEALVGNKTPREFVGSLRKLPLNVKDSIQSKLRGAQTEKKRFKIVEIEEVGGANTFEASYLTLRKQQDISKRLTPRQREVGNLLGEGHTKAEVARRLGISRQTVAEIERAASKKIK